MFEKEVKDYEISEKMLISELISQMSDSWGFTAGKIALGVKILENMVKDEECVKFLSFTANLVATGLRGVLKELVKRKLVDVIITTCGAIDHDLARCWRKYYRGGFLMDDRLLYEKGVNRLGNVLVPNESYGQIIEEKMSFLLESLWNEGVKQFSTRELCSEIGKRICNETSILHWAWRNNIPVYVPGITDGAVGYQLWLFSQGHKIKIDLLKDEQELNDLIFEAKRTGALIIGGGISKHHVIWWNQFKDGLDYAVYVSTAVEWDGSLSGARPREAVSWGKIKVEAPRVMIEGDATVILPMMISALLDRLSRQG